MTAKTCTEPGCDRPIHGRKLCHRHYAEWWRAGGETAGSVALDIGPLDRLLSQVQRPLEVVLDRNDLRALYRARKRGTISDAVADRIATYVLGMQLDVIYGPDYDEQDAEGVAA